MRITLDIDDHTVADELLHVLKQYCHRGVIIKSKVDSKILYTDEELRHDWRAVLSKGLGGLSDDYYKSDSYKLNRAAFSLEKIDE